MDRSEFLEQKIYKTRDAVVVDILFLDPDIVIGEGRALRGLPKIEICCDNLMCQDVFDVSGNRCESFQHISFHLPLSTFHQYRFPQSLPDVARAPAMDGRLALTADVDLDAMARFHF